MPSQSRRTFLVTGGTSGLGYEDVKALAAGTRVVISARNPQRGEETIARIRQEIPNARLQFEAIDLADLASACALSNRLQATLLRLGGLINNATIMAPPERGASANGFEMHFATNFLGHFLLTAGLLPVLRRSAPPPRVVTLSGIAVHRGAINFEDLQSTRAYDPCAAYAQSKLACLMFALDFQRRSEAAGWASRAWRLIPASQ